MPRQHRRPRRLKPRLTIALILAWADAFFRAHGHYPFYDSGPIAESPGDKWASVDKALREGRRGLPGGSSLTEFLNARRGIYRGKTRRPKRIRESERLRLEEILAWGKAYRSRHGKWPNRNSGAIPERNGLRWSVVDSALKAGNRGLPGGSSLAMVFKLRPPGL